MAFKGEGAGREVDDQLRSPPGYLLHMIPESAALLLTSVSETSFLLSLSWRGQQSEALLVGDSQQERGFHSPGRVLFPE